MVRSASDKDGKRALVIGGGLAGITTGFALAEAGYRVTIIEAASEVAMGASHANAGMITPSMSDPWNTPGIVGSVLKGLVTGRSPLKLDPLAVAQSWRWGLSFLRHSNEARFHKALRDNYALAEFSSRKLLALKAKLNLEFAHDAGGSIKLFRDAAAFEQSRLLAEEMRSHGLRYQLLSRQEVVDQEPVLAGSQNSIVGALYFPDDDVGDARIFTRALGEEFKKLGGTIRFNTSVQSMVSENGRVIGVQTPQEVLDADIVVVAAGIASRSLLRSCGEKVLIEPVKGYSLSFTLPNVEMPRCPIVDTSLHTVVSRIGDQLRVAGIAEIAGNDREIKRSRLQDLMGALHTLYPEQSDALSLEAARPWAGLRPVAADGLPYIGPAKLRGLFANTGHGHLGWTMAVGSAELLCAQITGAKPEIDPRPYALNR